MTEFISWYLAISLLGWLTLPLVFRLFHALPDRGFTMGRALGLLIWGYIFWLLASFGFVPNNLAGLFLAALGVLALSAWGLAGHWQEFRDWLRNHLRLIIVGELLFLLAFASMALIRAANPEIYGTEKPMELAFINAALRSPGFPPQDPWLSGYAISYYHFGYILTAMLARITGVPATVAFNLMLALVFGMGALGAYGVVFNLLALNRQEGQGSGALHSLPAGLALLGPLFLLIVSNVEGFLEALHSLGLFWKFHPDGTAVSSFWSWLDIKDLTQPPQLPLDLNPDRYLWWWRASRVVQDYDLAGNFQEVIDEFPAFSFVLGDLHPHVLAIPFGLLLVAFALNLYLGGLNGSLRLFGARLHISLSGFIAAALLLGGLAFLNIWDILMGAGLICVAYLLRRVVINGWNWEQLEELLLFGIVLAFSAFVLYLPFFVGFSSQAGGLLPNLVNPTRGAHLWVMFGSLFVPLGIFLVAVSGRPSSLLWKKTLWIALGLPLALWALSWLLAWLVAVLRPEFARQLLGSQNITGFGAYFMAAASRRLEFIFGLLTLIGMLLLSLRLVAIVPSVQVQEAEDTYLEKWNAGRDPLPFVGILVIFGTLLVLAPEFVYLRDQFGTRMNTIFKFYYQAWMLWSLASAFGFAFLLNKFRQDISWRFLGILVAFSLVLVVSLAYPFMAFANKTNFFKPAFGFTLDDFDRVRRENPDEAGAIEFLKTAPDGVVAEAVGGSYTGFARISTYTGLQTVLGWPGHEVQWRGTANPQGTRQDDIASLYTTRDWSTAHEILEKYRIRYVVVGALERQAYTVQEEKFRSHLLPVYQTGTITIYQVP